MAKRGGFPGGMPGNMNNLMKQAQRMQRQMEEQQAALETKEFTATAGGGVVEVTVTGKREVTKVKIDPEAVDPDDVEMLEDWFGDHGWNLVTANWTVISVVLQFVCAGLLILVAIRCVESWKRR